MAVPSGIAIASDVAGIERSSTIARAGTTMHDNKKNVAVRAAILVFAQGIALNAFAADDGPKLPWTADAIREAALTMAAADAPASRESLFGEGTAPKPNGPPAIAWRGFVRGELAYTYANPKHWSNMLVRSELDGEGALTDAIRYHIGARLDYDFVYDATNFYPPDVRRDQRFDAMARENYVDIGAGDWDFRLGRQQVVWGEMVGLFFADVVSAKDLREFILPDFDVIR